ncbi:Gfo/Idh/MocA family protein [Mucilaginibacter sp. KACC 22063]|uniref:Gfo/Idh/MocA family protein n=1 Tax=Mucilaginibacter sp. KACC 22063 TaxID=3025666 RepID=UPI00236511E3|nr:Gfo/Idh/MocA family oxidoreductase [Mucilaginibacter sp. KACC 22063]WDF55958.1 Gfo/Idh/MocA family oxidoreductase [Mucilaginibacter sp. KACC 22063]
MSDTITAGLLAYGMSGRIFHAPFLSTNPHFKLKAVVERHEKKAAQRYPDIVSYNHSFELLNDPEIELVVINTPNHTHYQLTKEALEAGKHVLLEKPAAPTAEQVKALFDLSRETGKKLMIYQNRRYDSGFRSVREIIESGRLGELIEVHFRYDRYRLPIGQKVFKESSGYVANGLTYDLGPHLLDQAIALFGKPLSFNKVTSTHRPNSQVDDYFSYQLNYPNGLNVFLTASLLVAEPSPAYIVHGTVGSYIKGQHDTQEKQLDSGMLPTDENYGVEAAGSEGKLVIMGVDNQKEISYVPSLKGNYNDIFDAAYNTIRHDALFPITEEQIAWQMEMLEA